MWSTPFCISLGIFSGTYCAERLSVGQLKFLERVIHILESEVILGSMYPVLSVEQWFLSLRLTVSGVLHMLLSILPLGHVHRLKHVVQLILHIFGFLLKLPVIVRINMGLVLFARVK